MILANCRLVPELTGGIGCDCGTVEIENGTISARSYRSAHAYYRSRRSRTGQGA